MVCAMTCLSSPVFRSDAQSGNAPPYLFSVVGMRVEGQRRSRGNAKSDRDWTRMTRLPVRPADSQVHGIRRPTAKNNAPKRISSAFSYVSHPYRSAAYPAGAFQCPGPLPGSAGGNAPSVGRISSPIPSASCVRTGDQLLTTAFALKDNPGSEIVMPKSLPSKALRYVGLHRAQHS